MMDTREYIDLLCKLIAIPSVSGSETAAANLLQSWMEERSLKVNRTVNNLWVDSDPLSDAPVLLLNAHIDTVKPAPSYTRDPFLPSVEGDFLYGLGSNDCGGSLVALLAAYRELSSREQPYRLIFSATAGEENCAPDGIEIFLGEIPVPALGIIGEPTGMQMAVAEKGLMVLDCTSFGVSGHAAREEGVNALYKALDDIQWFRSYAFPRVSDFLGPVKMSVTMIQCGVQHNVVPGECSFVVDVRPNGEYSNQEILSIIRENVGCEVKPRSLKHQSSSIAGDHPVVVRGLGMGLEAYGSPTTSNQTRCDFPTLKIGPGQSSRSHMADEYIRISEIEQAVRVYVDLLDGLKI
ncbi:MAG: M20/M25/M40 family metallo-hydrolase [Bacteroidales bacterium]|nr:M20/M25/M40 family metallo-hydrolase [Bacteroidales bacterium]